MSVSYVPHKEQPQVTEPFRHEALLYAGEDEFVTQCASFIRGGVAGNEPTLVVVSARKIDRLREELGPDADAVYFADMADVGHNPARIIPAWEQFVTRNAAPRVQLRGIGEPIFPERPADELVECQRHESLLNLAFADTQAFWLLCPYDTDALPAPVIEEARRSHPVVAFGEEREPSVAYPGLEGVGAVLTVPISNPPPHAAELTFGDDALEGVRRFVADHAADAGLGMNRRIDLIVAVNEIATNSLRHGGGRGTLRVWREPRRIVCEVRDSGRIDDPLVDRRLPSPDEPRGRGLWMANQLCDLVQVRSFPTGTVVRVHAYVG